MAPERIDPSRSAGGGFRIQADVWSLGLTLLELATGKHPYESFVNQFELLKHVSVSFGSLVFRMTECEFLYQIAAKMSFKEYKNIRTWELFLIQWHA